MATEEWDPQPGERPKAYESFRVYRDLGPKRTLLAASQAIKGETGGKKGGKPPSHIERLASKWRWRERAKAYDDRHDRIRSETTAAVIAAEAKTDAQVGVERRRTIQESLWAHFDFADRKLREVMQGNAGLKEVEGWQEIYLKAIPLAKEAVAMMLPADAVAAPASSTLTAAEAMAARDAIRKTREAARRKEQGG